MVPGFQSFMLPVLKKLSDGNEYRSRDLMELIATDFQLSVADKNERIPSGTQPVYENRYNWAKYYMKRAGLVDAPKRSTVAITERGREVLKQNLEKIDINFLKQYPAFVEFIGASKSGSTVEATLPQEIAQKTPEEILGSAYNSLREELAAQLVKKAMQLSSSTFEKLVVELLVKIGYGGTLKDAGEAIGKSGDDGVDGMIKEDKLGLDVIYIQAKKWQNNVQSSDIRDFIGALDIKRARKGVFITTSNYSSGAKTTAASSNFKVILINGEQLAQLMIDYNIGVASEKTYEVKKIDNDYFEED